MTKEISKSKLKKDSLLEALTNNAFEGVRITGDISRPKKLSPYDHVHRHIPSLNFRLNLVTKKVEHLNLKDVDDVEINSIYLDIKEKCDRVSKGLVTDYLLSDRLEEYHPFREYFDSITAIDSSEYLDKLFDSLNIDFENKTDYSICKGLFIKWLLQFFASAYHSGPLDLMMVFTGSQNSGKTYFFENILPKELSKYVTTIKDFPRKEEDAKMMMCNSLLLLRDDITGVGGKDKDWIKSILSNQELSYRAPYGKSTAKYRRYAVLCATSNDMGVITSEEKANRRIFPLKINKRNHQLFDEVLSNGIDVFWGELKNIWNKATNKRDLYRVSKKEIEFLSTLTEFRETDEMHEVITKYFVADPNGKCTVTDIKIRLKRETLKEYHRNNIGKYLNQIKVESNRTTAKGKSVKYYKLKSIEAPYETPLPETDESSTPRGNTQ